MDNTKTGIFLINLGSPDSPEIPHVRKYLREFLGDPYVLDMPSVLRFLLLNFVILPKRPALSSEAYKKIWTDKGSPLITNTAALTDSLQTKLSGFDDENFSVKYGMRYGNPSIKEVLQKFYDEGIKKIKVIPLYPQYAAATTETSIVETKRAAALISKEFQLEFITSFYNHPGFYEPFARIIREETDKYARENSIIFDHFIFSYHGLPEKAVLKADTSHRCLITAGCCEKMAGWNSNCYRAQCFETTRLIAKAMEIGDHWWTVSFQSRLGKTPWILPHTDRMIKNMPRMGFKNIALVAPSFVSDCLETLEEINMRGREMFTGAGGTHFLYVHSLNFENMWVNGLVKILDIPEKK